MPHVRRNFLPPGHRARCEGRHARHGSVSVLGVQRRVRRPPPVAQQGGRVCAQARARLRSRACSAGLSALWAHAARV